MSCVTHFPSDQAFDLFLRSVDIDTVRIEQTARMTEYEWHALARDRRNR